MTRPLEGRRVALAESRQIEELALMLEKEGAVPLRCPMFGILDAPDAAPVLEWLGELIAGRFDWVVLMTGEALRRLLGFAERAELREAVVAALAKTRVRTRGPEPVAALREVGLAPTAAWPRRRPPPASPPPSAKKTCAARRWASPSTANRTRR